MDNFDNSNHDVDSLISQLKQNHTLIKEINKETNILKKEESEKFVIEKSGELVREGIDLLKEIKLTMSAGGFADSEQISALASLMTATTSSLEALNKLIVTDKKNETIITAKKMDIEARKNQMDDGPVKLLITREELLKNLLNSVSEQTKTIDISSTPV